MNPCPLNLKHGDQPDRLFDKAQLRIGIQTEKEHTDATWLAKQIAKAHLVEDPYYYTKLRKAGL